MSDFDLAAQRRPGRLSRSWSGMLPPGLGLALALLLAGPGCGSHIESSPADFAGYWTSVSGFNQLTCSGKPIDDPFQPFTILMRVGTTSDLELVEVDQSDFVTEVCRYGFSISGTAAMLDGAQSCSVDDGSGALFTTTYTADTLTLTASGMHLSEVSSLDDSDDCHTEGTRHYERGKP